MSTQSEFYERLLREPILRVPIHNGGGLRRGLPAMVVVVSWDTRKRGRSMNHAVHPYRTDGTSNDFTWCGRVVPRRGRRFGEFEVTLAHVMSWTRDACTRCDVTQFELTIAPFALRCIPVFNDFYDGVGCSLCREQMRLWEATSDDPRQPYRPFSNVQGSAII